MCSPQGIGPEVGRNPGPLPGLVDLIPSLRAGTQNNDIGQQAWRKKNSRLGIVFTQLIRRTVNHRGNIYIDLSNNSEAIVRQDSEK